MKRAGVSLAIALAATWPSCAQTLPTNPEPEAVEVEPAILPGNLLPEKEAPPPGNVGELERKLARAKSSAAGAERLWKIGVLAKVEAENRALRVVRLETELAMARLAMANETDKEQLEKAAQEASAKQKQAELDAAAINLQRRQKLFALGSGGRSSVRKAEEKLAELKADAP